MCEILGSNIDKLFGIFDEHGRSLEAENRLWASLRCLAVSNSVIFGENMQIFLFHRDGRSRAGVYCSANACIEQVIQHGEVDVFQAVKTVRRHRPQLVDNMVRKWNPIGIIISNINIYFQTEYKYCYDLVLHYVLHFLNKDK